MEFKIFPDDIPKPCDGIAGAEVVGVGDADPPTIFIPLPEWVIMSATVTEAEALLLMLKVFPTFPL